MFLSWTGWNDSTTILKFVQWKSWLLLTFTTWVLLCTLLRHRQRLAIEKRFGYGTRASLAKMTLNDAYTIQTWLAEQEFPKTFSTAIFFALFKTYGIPSISKLLVSTGHLVNMQDSTASSKRVADTSVLLTNMVIGKPGSKRVMEAIARTNYIHCSFRRSGRISDDDMLYTLSLFTLEAIRWTDKYEWRGLTDMERCAMATFWKALGEDLEIGYERLPSHELGWKNGLDWLEELDNWSQQYEERYMVPSDYNAQLADVTMDILLHELPRSLKGMGRNIISAILSPRLREAMKIPSPPPIYETVFNYFILLRKFLLRHIFLPRPYFLRHKHILDKPDPLTGRYHVPRWRMHPWYAKPSKERWGLGTLLRGGSRSRVEQTQFIPEGYLIREVGPKGQIGKGLKEMDEMIDVFRMKDPGRCPFLL